jgi:hypothetical protein
MWSISGRARSRKRTREQRPVEKRTREGAADTRSESFVPGLKGIPVDIRSESLVRGLVGIRPIVEAVAMWSGRTGIRLTKNYKK